MASTEIKALSFISGESSSPDLSDGGFSPDSFGINLSKTKGMLYFTESPTERAGVTLTGNIVASCVDPALTGNDAYYIADDGSFYTYNGTTFTDKRAAAANYTYQLGSTDMIPFNDGNFYFTSKTTIGQFDNNMGTVTEDWWSGLDSSYRHPVEVVEKKLFVGDKNLILYYDGTTSGTAFTLPAGQNITSLRKRPNGTSLLAFTGGTADFSHTRNGAGKVYYCDPTLQGASVDGWSREVELEAQVEGTRNVGGTIFVTWGKNVGIFDGNGLTPLNKVLETSGTTYSQSMTNMEDIFVIRDGRLVLCYGNLGNGNAWWKLHREAVDDINNLHYKGDNVLLMATDNDDLNEIDLDTAGTNGQFRTNRMTYNSEVEVKRFDLIHDETTISTVATFSEVKLDGSTNIIESKEYSTATHFTRFPSDIKSNMFQFGINPSSGAIGYKYIRIGYDPIK